MMKTKLLILILFLLLFKLKSQERLDFYPKSPQASSLSSLIYLPINKAVGKVNPSINLFTIDIDGYQLPITLNYSYSGYKPSDQVGILGRGWSITNTGIISQSVRGADDFSAMGFSGSSRVGKNIIKPFLEENVSLTTHQITTIITDDIDSEPDVFSFNAGNVNSKFLINYDNEVVFTDGEKVKVNFNNSTNPNFNIIDKTGVSYIFGMTEYSFPSSATKVNKSAYNLTNIKTIKNNDIIFNYSKNVRQFETISNTIKDIAGVQSPNSPCKETGGISHSSDIVSIDENLVNEIIYLKNKLTFSYETVFRNYSEEKLLTEVKVFNNNSLITKYKFTYDNSKNFLLKVEKLDSNGFVIESYNFEYHQTENFTDKSLYATDEYGYYNGKDTNQDLFFGNKSVDYEKTLIGALKKITYPTKGYTEFTYEQNEVKGQPKSSYDCNIALSNNKSFFVSSSTNLKIIKDSVYIPFPQTIKLTILAKAEKINGQGYRIVESSAKAKLPNGAYKMDCSSSDKLFAYAYNELSPENPDGNTIDKMELFDSYWYVPAGYVSVDLSTSNVGSTNSSGYGSASVIIDYNTNDIFKIGGLRIKTQKDCDFNNTCIEKEYDYTDDDGKPSSVLSLNPFHKSIFKCTFIDNANGGGSHSSIIYSTTKNNLPPLNSFAGTPVTYKKVTERIKNKPGAVSSYYTFRPVTGNGLISSLAPTDLFVNTIGKEQKTVYTKNTDTLSTENNLYDIKYFNSKKTNGFDMRLKNIFYFSFRDSSGYTGIAYYPPTINDVDYYPYSYLNNNFKLVEKKSNDYFNGNKVKKITSYNYNSDLDIASQKITFPDNSLQETTYQYAHDKNKTKLIEANMVGIPLETTVVKKQNASDPGKTISKTYTDYPDTLPDTQTGNLLLPKSASALDLVTGNMSTEVTYNQYDNKGNILQYTAKNGVPTAIIWDKSQTQPIAKVEGATYAQASAVAGDIVTASDQSQASYSEANLLAKLDAFRNNSVLSGFQITTYTYKPLIGVTSITPPSGIREIYIYDTANKLQEVRDVNGNLLKSYEYHYKP